MTKSWCMLNVGDKVMAIENGLDYTSGKVYEVIRVYDGDMVRIIDDVEEGHDVSEEDGFVVFDNEEGGAEMVNSEGTYSKGDFVCIVGNNNGHGFGFGDVVEIVSDDGTDESYLAQDTKGNEWWVWPDEIEFIDATIPVSEIVDVKVPEILRKNPEEVNVKPGQIRMSADKESVAIVCHNIGGNGLNALIIKDFSDLDDLSWEINWPKGADEQEVHNEYPILLSAEINIKEAL